MVTPLSQEIRHSLGSNCGPTVSALRDLIKGPINAILREADVEVKAAKAENGASSFESLFQDIGAATEAEIDSVFGSLSTEVPAAIADLIGSAGGDVLGIIQGTLSGILTPSNLEDDCGSQIGTSIVTAAFSGISSQLQGEVDRANVLAGQASSIFSALRSSDKGGEGSFGLGLLHGTLDAFKSTVSNELFILNELPKLIQAINKNVKKLVDSDYSTDHLLLVAICQQLLLDANSKLGTVLLGMQSGGRLNTDLFTIARDDIKIAKELLSGFELSDIFGKLTSPLTLKIAAQITLLVAYTQALEQVARINRGKADRIGGFVLQYKLFQPNIDFLYAPTIQLISCRLNKIILDMGATANLNQVFVFMTREKKWYLQLAIVLALMDGCKLLNKANSNLEKIKVDWQDHVKAVADSYPTQLSLSSLTYGEAVEILGLSGAVTREEIEAAYRALSSPLEAQLTGEDTDAGIHRKLEALAAARRVALGQEITTQPQVIPELKAYTALVKQKLSFNISTSVVVNRGEFTIDLINAYLTDATAMAGRRLAEDVFGGILPEGIGTNIALTEIANPLVNAMGALESAAGPGIALAQTYMSYLDKNGMTGFADALKEGDVSKFFSLDGFTSIIYAQAGEYVNAAFNCYADQGDPVAMNTLRRNGALFQEQRRADDLFRLSTSGAAQEHTDVLINTEIPETKETVALLNSI